MREPTTSRASGLYRRLPSADKSLTDTDIKSQRSLLLAMQDLLQKASQAAKAESPWQTRKGFIGKRWNWLT